MKYIPVIGLEIHAELLTKTKIFCRCENSFGGKPNTRVCPICCGFPGTLPNLNREAVYLAAKAGFAVGGKINEYFSFDRKNYSYPDLPKAYQITQVQNPIVTGGNINGFRINHIHLEEDAGKMIHENGISKIDYNRCGVPLIEIVTEPDFRSAEDVCSFVSELALRLKYSGICDSKMEQGSLRVDVNISLTTTDGKALGTRIEIKNINSVKAMGRAISFEIKRQSDLLSSGKEIVGETRRYNDSTFETEPMRSKEDINDYRYFPEPDIPAVHLSEEELKSIKESLPEMPDIKLERYKNYMTNDEARLIAENKEFAEYYDRAVSVGGYHKKIAVLMLTGLKKLLNIPLCDLKFSEKDLSELASLWDDNKITAGNALKVLEIMYNEGGNPTEISKRENMIIANNLEELEIITKKVLKENEKAVSDYKNGNKNVFGFLTGKVIRAAGNSANPTSVREILRKYIG